jgi:hypothetical protein
MPRMRQIHHYTIIMKNVKCHERTIKFFLIIFNIYSNKKIPLNQLDINQQSTMK